MPNPIAHPARLRALTIAYGSVAPTLAPFRYLDLACGTGEDLLPLAAQFPASTFVGCDTPDAIEAAAASARRAGLSNVTFVTRELVTGRFDFIVAHGVYAGSSIDERRRLLALIGRSLTQEGVAVVSYPTLPGASLRQLVRESLARAIRPEMSPSEQSWGVRGRLAKLARALPNRADPHLELLRREFGRMESELDARTLTPLAPEAPPLHVAEFIARAREHGLEFLADALPATADGALELDVVPNLVAEGLTRVEAEEALDLLSNRRARATLLVPSGQSVSPRPRYEALLPKGRFAAPFAFATEALDLTPGIANTFETAHGAHVTSDDPLLKAALVTLAERWPRGLTEGELRAAVVEQLELRNLATPELCATAELDATLDAMMELVRRRHVELVPWNPDYSDELDHAPRIRSVTRLELERGATITSARHEPVVLDAVFHAVAVSLDGSHGLVDCVRILTQRIEAGVIALADLPTDAEARDRALQTLVLAVLVRLRNLGVLEPPLQNTKPLDTEEST